MASLARDEAPRIEHVLFSTNQVRDRVAELGREISEDYKRRAPVLVGVLRGGLCFLADLMREVSLPVSVDFLSISAPGADNQGVRITKELDTEHPGAKHVILVEDVVDTGMSLGYIISYLKTKRPASVEVCALLDKKIRRIADVPLRYVGFETPDEFVVGYGLDYLERLPQPPLHRRPQTGGGGRERGGGAVGRVAVAEPIVRLAEERDVDEVARLTGRVGRGRHRLGTGPQRPHRRSPASRGRSSTLRSKTAA